MSVKQITAAWTRNATDDAAVADGCTFDVSRAAWVVWWIERYCRLYEGEHAGEPVLLRSGCDAIDKPIHTDWDSGGESLSIDRAAKYIEWLKQGNRPDWQYECTMRMFGWVRHSDRWGRMIRRFNAASIWIPKKQKKTPTLAAWGVYLICGDGEQGGKVFGGAKDGKQAGLAMAHAMAMVEQSPELSAECKINRNASSITHMPTRSVYIPLSSADSRTKDAKEGINGSILIDETHVVDRDFIEIIKRAGISRSEPLRIEVSTAGNNPDGYGKERQDYARQVLNGTVANKQLFVAIYEAPQDLTDADLANDPVKYGKIANPAWGHTAHEEEYLADYEESKATPAKLRAFKMYRLNVWSNAPDVWLIADKWRACAGDAMMPGTAQLAAGLDLSKTRDMSALAYACESDGKTVLRCDLWITEAYVEKYADKAAFDQWEASGELHVIPGDTIRQSYIRERFSELCEEHDVRCLVYDRTYAQDFVDWCEETHKKVLCVECPQSAAIYEELIDDFEASVLEQRLEHDGNRCLTWQAGHCETKTNFKGHRVLCKPNNRNDCRKIDGLVASVMASWGVKKMPRKKSVYKRRGVLCA